jgi:hypothetical protein
MFLDARVDETHHSLLRNVDADTSDQSLVL